jgi:hypothetical protein
VQRLHPRFVSQIDILLDVLLIASFLVPLLPPMLGTGCRRVSVLNIKSSRITHVPVVIQFYDVRYQCELTRASGEPAHRHRSSSVRRWYLWSIGSGNVIHKRSSRATSSTAAPSASPAPATALPCLLIIVVSSLRGNSNLGHWGDAVICRWRGVLPRRCANRWRHVRRCNCRRWQLLLIVGCD